ncbi:winged helix-turn-helix domain-containing protein [Pedobacter foliorum]|uniref:winged helix-turn-helix domain-containing protein n=1 Tax=Pedobacter foliorum TaxID=2739058 RepID=UPI001566BE97|nr:winged helix-turn-helix domain-containing protein [Pedobacter foliorum]NRF38027.1 winged helix-turn-helix transcriptional regulator [Pedobacter foliorum]
MVITLVNRIIGALMLSFLLLQTGVAFAKQESGTRQIISFRKLGHQLLLSAGDSTSRILSVEEEKEGSYRISFDKSFALIPDTLAAIATRLTSSNDLQGNYTLAVYRKGGDQLLYGFTSEDISKGTAPCMGRALPIDNYEIHIQVSDVAVASGGQILSLNQGILSFLFIAGVSAAGFGIYKKRLLKKNSSNSIAIGKYMYDPAKQILSYGGEEVILTPKEQSLLKIFLKNPNEVIDRNLLLKLGWEDEGVITGRSLDMYVSKLRKKFSQDDAICFKNVHGKGYSLNIEGSIKVNMI